MRLHIFQTPMQDDTVRMVDSGKSTVRTAMHTIPECNDSSKVYVKLTET